MFQVILDSANISAPAYANAITSRCRAKQNPPWWIFWPDRDTLSDSGTCNRTRAWSLRKHPDRKLISRCWSDRMALQRHKSVDEDRVFSNWVCHPPSIHKYFHWWGSFLYDRALRHSSMGIFSASRTDIAYWLKLIKLYLVWRLFVETRS